jgi:excinuclease ABC subunit B
MIREIGYCSGVENYSRYFDGREAGTPPFCLLDFFPDDFLLVIDESHVTVPQIHAMYGGDAARKKNLVEYGFRLPAAMDNRPLKFEEFEQKQGQTIYVSATPADYELNKCGGVVVEQIIRPTGLLDPEIEVRPSKNQIDDLLEEIAVRAEKDQRTLVTTLTKRMAEELDVFLKKNGVRSTYIHSDIDTLERVQILEDLRKGLYDVLIGVNLLREGIDLPQVSLVAILDADKEGFLRSHRSLTQTAGRAARHLEGKVLMYADTITDSMRKTIDETNRRRSIQQAYNKENGITPKALSKKAAHALSGYEITNEKSPFDKLRDRINEPSKLTAVAADPVIEHMSKAQLEKAIATTKKRMLEASKNLDFLQAAQYRDEMLRLEDLLQHTQK